MPPGGAAHLAPEHHSLKREKDAQRESRASRALHTSRDYMVPGSTICNMSHKGHTMTYLEYRARQFVDTWYCLIDMERAKLMSPLLRDRLQAVIAQTWAEEGRGVDGEL